jgi:hypothetical protein
MSCATGWRFVTDERGENVSTFTQPAPIEIVAGINDDPHVKTR